MSKKKSPENPIDQPVIEVDLSEEIVVDESTQPLTKETNNNQEAEVNIDKLVEAMATFKAEAEKNLDGGQRERADFQNYKRRVEREQKDFQRKAELDSVKLIFPIIDDFERAVTNIPEDLQNHGWVTGTSLILGKFKRLFEAYDISPIAPVNEPFDPYLHQAISKEDSDTVESGYVIETLQKGYKSGDIILRPALVRVAN
ncbi:MAG TPA: nucleotide exchange factor GrpE [Aggregatilineales bacterium]|nr:nucleotide exchange factor GrpE [Aggregatilineales bacterium]